MLILLARIKWWKYRCKKLNDHAADVESENDALKLELADYQKIMDAVASRATRAKKDATRRRT